MPSSSSHSSANESNFTRATPTLSELQDLVQNNELCPLVTAAFPLGHTSSSNIRHFTSLSRIIRRMELDLVQYRQEREDIFDDIQNSVHYQQTIRPLFRYYQRTFTRTRHHPYNQPGRPTRSSSSNSAREVTILSMEDFAPRSPVITPESADALLHPLPPSTTSSSSSYRSANDRSLSLGTQEHPIVVEDDDDFDCTRCNQNGHLRNECDTPLRPASPCPVCAWTRQQHCDHIQITPAWTRHQQLNIERRRYTSSENPDFHL